MRGLTLLVVVAGFLWLGPAFSGGAPEDDPTLSSAIWQLRKSGLIHRDGQHNVLLRALRHLDDPSLAPYFESLTRKGHPVLKIHGVLGLSEIASPERLDLAKLAELKDPTTQAQVITASLDAKLLDTPHAKTLMGWPGMDLGLKMIVAPKLVSEKAFNDKGLLQEAAGSDKLAIRAMSALLSLQMGDRSAMEKLHQLDLSEDKSRDAVRSMLLQTAIQYKFETVAEWALQVALEAKENQALTTLALRAALNFKAQDAAEVWTQRYTSTTNPADRIRLAVLAVDQAHNLDPKLFGRMAQDDQEVIQKMGQVGARIAQGQPADDQIIQMLELNHLMAGKWVLKHAMDAPYDRTEPILVALILVGEGEPNPARFRLERMEDVVVATEYLAENSPEPDKIIGAILQQVPTLTQEAMLMGLITSKAPRAHLLLEKVGPLKSETARSLALLLKARGGGKLTPQELDHLGLIVRGGAGLQDPLRVQASWIWLKLTGHQKQALAEAIK